MSELTRHGFEQVWQYSHLHVRMAHLDIDAMPTWIVKTVSILLAGCSVLALGGLPMTAMH
jgi:hypothetical protein